MCVIKQFYKSIQQLVDFGFFWLNKQNIRYLWSNKFKFLSYIEVLSEDIVVQIMRFLHNPWKMHFLPLSYQ